MAEDKSIITVPSINNTVIVPKVNAQSIEEFVYNNGIFISKSSLSKTLPKSLVRLWKKGNKIYLFDKDTTVLENSIDFISANTTPQLNVSRLEVKFTTTSGDYYATKQVNPLFFVNQFFGLTNDSEEKAAKAISSTLVSSETLKNYENLNNKQLKLYNLKPIISTNYLTKYYLPFVGEDGNSTINTVINSNFFLRLKSIFTNNEIVANYNNFVYLISNWVFPYIDTITSAFNIEISNKNIKSKLVGPLIENDLELRRSVPILNYRHINYNFVQKFENVNVQNTNNNVLGEKKALTIIKNTEFIIPETNKVLVFINKQNNYIFSFLVTSIEDAYYNTAGGGVETYSNVAIRYETQPIYNKINAPAYLTNFNSSYTSDLNKNFDMYVINLNEYENLVAYNTSILELETDDTTFNTITDGDYYVVEIE